MSVQQGPTVIDEILEAMLTIDKVQPEALALLADKYDAIRVKGLAGFSTWAAAIRATAERTKEASPEQGAAIEERLGVLGHMKGVMDHAGQAIVAMLRLMAIAPPELRRVMPHLMGDLAEVVSAFASVFVSAFGSPETRTFVQGARREEVVN